MTELINSNRVTYPVLEAELLEMIEGSIRSRHFNLLIHSFILYDSLAHRR